ncbi:MAG: hypothetical protein ACUVYA_19080, partial [Planctomycetota bacterium]
TPELERLAAHLNRRERAIAYAERRLRRRRILEFLEKRSGEVQAGIVLRVLDDGLVVSLPGFLVSGFLDFASLGPGAVRMGAQAIRAGGKTLRPGAEVHVLPRRIDPVQGELDLRLARSEDSERLSRRKPG